MTVKYDILDLKLAKFGKKKIEWAGLQMPVLQVIGKRFAKEKTLKSVNIGACLHVTAETANLMLALKSGGAQISLCASNPLSTQDEVAASLVKDFEISVFAIKGENNSLYYEHLNKVLDTNPEITMDDGADLVTLLHTKRVSQIKNVIGSSEETTTGVIRLRAMEKDGSLKLPVMAVNDSDTKHLFDNRYGTGQSTIDGILRSTNILLAGKTIVVAGYGWCSRGIANKVRGMGANVIVTEVDPVKALEAYMDGFRVMPMNAAARLGRIFITATGDKNVVTVSHMKLMQSGAILANSGHFNVEIEVDKLIKSAKEKRLIRENLEEYTLKDGKKIYILAEGRLVNLAAAEGHPAEVMDLSFSNQALAAEWFVENKNKLAVKVYKLPINLDTKVAELKLEAMDIKIDALTPEQKKYLQSWQEGT
ncbi:adenosylhomocysteinase [Candidatus Woesebacteria bacterium RIFCSPHIGHO2_02_FULL_38_9]|uniref:Adenosylhomocysteinase n=1 Tax=Candidatus Woesebacteria bacterium RIFCSPHIGHO2_01_FULL_39_28 TaxID=1802496 RepID=A0A1F7YG43_9BACT|nr:MAG: adenosylhomocysteinase [Candidatus Woesebacteria bacterium RIFCSPHIGHO2_01_FULL_39_28]OGM33641.1 MAG: adenosylhomocysteinase [Candidatus Woesebacteria bacterium RIFCSPHIGHO2_02_FULL_38_9]OGM58538.1 MAG: adenosylhomocysteinase [Candidatus Woesebacteria bacterium RIFCSPLOWO2_01_FULL_38_20]